MTMRMKNFVRSVHLNARMRAWFSLAALLVVRPAWGADSREKSHYTLFNPTPKDLMREMRTDRPDKTERRMEADGLVSRPDHVGRREVMMDTDGRQI